MLALVDAIASDFGDPAEADGCARVPPIANRRDYRAIIPEFGHLTPLAEIATS